MIEFEVIGRAQPAGSKRAFPFQKASGKLGVRVSDMNPNAAAWKERVAQAAHAAYGDRPPLEGPIRLVVSFARLRPKSHFKKSGALKDGAPTYPITQPDTTKTLRAFEDALNGLVWRDDSQVVMQEACKVFAEVEKTTVLIFTLDGD